MSVEGMSVFITQYIAERWQKKLETFDKKAAKRGTEDSATLAQERYELAHRYEPKNWLTDAAKRAGKISLVTHAAKFTHGASKSSSVLSSVVVAEGYLNSAALAEPETDAVRNAAVLDVAKFLQTRYEGDSLLACLQRGDTRPFAAFTDDAAQLNEWICGFSRALSTGEPASHKLAKQIYFPVKGGYHLLGPLFATSFVHAFHQKLTALRFGDEARAIWKARRDNTWHPQPLVTFPRSAEMHFGGTNSQNISWLNSVRSGRVWLLSAQPPRWQTLQKPPVKMRSLFAAEEEFDRRAGNDVEAMIAAINTPGNNVQIRDDRNNCLDRIIDLLFVIVSKLQREAWQSWTLNCPSLRAHQQLWLDPWRAQTDDAFRQEREKGDWQEQVAQDFALWLNGRLRKVFREVGQAENREWRTAEHFSAQLRITEKIVKEALQ